MNRVWHLGTDEAGYGPTLGPLVIAGTLWSCPPDRPPATWYDFLATEIPAKTSPLRNDEPVRSLRIEDSKKLYRGTHDFTKLELSAWAILGQVVPFPCAWPELLGYLDPEAKAWLSGVPWLADFARQLPIKTPLPEVRQQIRRLTSALHRNGFLLERVGVHFLPAARFNHLLDQFHLKSDLLSVMTLTLIKRLLPRSEDTHICADKHGGRMHYLSYLDSIFGGEAICVIRESKESSEYHMSQAGRRLEFRFLAKGESLFAVAASSLIAKYLREVAMLAFNEFWQRLDPTLRPTAGYPQDAQRFLREIEPYRERLGLPDTCLRRKK